MPINFPVTLDDFTNPTPSDDLNTPAVLHSTQHANINDAVEALQAKVGVDSSAVTTSLDYKVAQLETDKQDALGYTAEDAANKDTDGALAANSDTKYPSQKAVKTYVDNNPGGWLTHPQVMARIGLR